MDGSHPTNPMEFPACGPEEERRARHLRILTELADIGMELVGHVRRQVLEEEVPPGVDPVLAFARLAKAVRQTLALEAKVAAGGFNTPMSVARGAAKSEGAWRIWDGKSKAKVRKKVEEAIASDADAGDAEDLLRDLNERPDDAEYGDEMSDRPIGMIVAMICGDLGVKIDLGCFSDAELGFDTEAMKSPDWKPAELPWDVPARVVSGGPDDDKALPLRPPRGRTGSDPP
jgi:hypothetical protein